MVDIPVDDEVVVSEQIEDTEQKPLKGMESDENLTEDLWGNKVNGDKHSPNVEYKQDLQHLDLLNAVEAEPRKNPQKDPQKRTRDLIYDTIADDIFGDKEIEVWLKAYVVEGSDEAGKTMTVRLHGDAKRQKIELPSREKLKGGGVATKEMKINISRRVDREAIRENTARVPENAVPARTSDAKPPRKRLENSNEISNSPSVSEIDRDNYFKVEITDVVGAIADKKMELMEIYVKYCKVPNTCGGEEQGPFYDGCCGCCEQMHYFFRCVYVFFLNCSSGNCCGINCCGHAEEKAYPDPPPSRVNRKPRREIYTMSDIYRALLDKDGNGVVDNDEMESFSWILIKEDGTYCRPWSSIRRYHDIPEGCDPNKPHRQVPTLKLLAVPRITGLEVGPHKVLEKKALWDFTMLFVRTFWAWCFVCYIVCIFTIVASVSVEVCVSIYLTIQEDSNKFIYLFVACYCLYMFIYIFNLYLFLLIECLEAFWSPTLNLSRLAIYSPQWMDITVEYGDQIRAGIVALVLPATFVFGTVVREADDDYTSSIEGGIVITGFGYVTIFLGFAVSSIYCLFMMIVDAYSMWKGIAKEEYLDSTLEWTSWKSRRGYATDHYCPYRNFHYVLWRYECPEDHREKLEGLLKWDYISHVATHSIIPYHLVLGPIIIFLIMFWALGNNGINAAIFFMFLPWISYLVYIMRDWRQEAMKFRGFDLFKDRHMRTNACCLCCHLALFRICCCPWTCTRGGGREARAESRELELQPTLQMTAESPREEGREEPEADPAAATKLPDPSEPPRATSGQSLSVESAPHSSADYRTFTNATMASHHKTSAEHTHKQKKRLSMQSWVIAGFIILGVCFMLYQAVLVKDMDEETNSKPEIKWNSNEYPMCRLTFENLLMSEVKYSLDVVDGIFLAKTSYREDESTATQNLQSYFAKRWCNATYDTDWRSACLKNQTNGCLDDQWRYVAGNFRTSGTQWFHICMPEAGYHVVAVRGTATTRDMIADMTLFVEVTVLQAIGLFVPILNLWTMSLITTIVDRGSFYSGLMNDKAELQYYQDPYDHMKNYPLNSTEFVMFAGHSLGGGVAQIAASKLHPHHKNVMSFALSSPGMSYSSKKFRYTTRDLGYVSINVIGKRDILAMVDKHQGLMTWMECDAATMAQCHFIDTSLCTAVSSCWNDFWKNAEVVNGTCKEIKDDSFGRGAKFLRIVGDDQLAEENQGNSELQGLCDLKSSYSVCNN